jgi:putative two-component system response regulator
MTDSYNRKILVVDDQPEILEDYIRILGSSTHEKGDELTALETELFGNPNDTARISNISSLIEEEYTIDTASQGAEAISLVKQSVKHKVPFAVAFMDVRMPPGINGVQAASEIRKIDSDIEIVFVTAYSDVSRNDILDQMGTSDKILYIRKPFDADEIKQLALTLTEKWNLNKTIDKKTEELKLAHSITMRALAGLAELRDTDTGNHLKRVAEYSKFIAQELGKFTAPKWCKYITPLYIEDIGQSSVLHDIGKVGIADGVLLKKGKLTSSEFELMKSHSTIGGDALARADEELGIRSFLTLAKEIAYHHHEKHDGTGYPKGLKGEEIPLSARIVALADVYDALTSDRPYREALPHEMAANIITGEMGRKHFDPIVLDVFINNQHVFQKIREKYS